MAKTHKIVLTGGPCAGKTTSITRIRNFLQDRGIAVITIPEAATLVASTGAGLCNQKSITWTQKNQEDVFFWHAEEVRKESKKDVVVLLDRGIIDGAVYTDKPKFEKILSECGLSSFDNVYKRYDHVLHLVSAAKGAENFYDKNEVRHEDLSNARSIEKRTFELWSGFEGIKTFDNFNKSFEAKMRNVVGFICEILDIPHTQKLPKKYLVDGKSTKVPENIPQTKMEIEKVFITNVEGSHTTIPIPEDQAAYSFIRRSICNGISSFVIKTVSFRSNQRIERKENLTPRQFELLKLFADPQRSIVKQKRLLFSVGDAHMELCWYIEPSENLCQLSVHLPPQNKRDLSLPPWLEIKEEVTNYHNYSSHFISLHEKKDTYEFNHADHVVFERKPNGKAEQAE